MIPRKMYVMFIIYFFVVIFLDSNNLFIYLFFLHHSTENIQSKIQTKNWDHNYSKIYVHIYSR